MVEASSSSFSTKTTVMNVKFECEVLDVLYQQELDLTLKEKPDKIDDKKWIKINKQAYGTSRLCLPKD